MQLFSNENPPKNRWYWLRHGQSIANVNHVVASDAATAVDGFGLSSLGQQQVRNTLSKNTAPADKSALNADTRVITSDFLRTRQTAQIVIHYLQCHQPLSIDIRLRERYFGKLEATSADNYNQVWQQDAIDPEHTMSSVESVSSVARRMSELVISLEEQFEKQTILLVSHGDPLQILECCLVGHPITQHRSLKPLTTAELRSLEL